MFLLERLQHHCSILLKKLENSCVLKLYLPLSYAFVFQLVQRLHEDGWKYNSNTEWWGALREKIAANAKISKVCSGSLLQLIF